MRKSIELFTHVMVANPHPKSYHVIACTLGDAEATQVYFGYDVEEAQQAFDNYTIGDKAIKSFFWDGEVWMREDNIKQEFPEELREEVMMASEERFNELLMIYFADRFDVQKKVFMKFGKTARANGIEVSE